MTGSIPIAMTPSELTLIAADPTILGASSPMGDSALGDPFADALVALPGITEMWPILVIVVLLFGARKLPELARAMGSSVTQFRRGLETAEDDLKSVDKPGDESAE